MANFVFKSKIYGVNQQYDPKFDTYFLNYRVVVEYDQGAWFKVRATSTRGKLRTATLDLNPPLNPKPIVVTRELMITQRVLSRDYSGFDTLVLQAYDYTGTKVTIWDIIAFPIAVYKMSKMMSPPVATLRQKVEIT